jgi:FMN reductase [NAD(P)H]
MSDNNMPSHHGVVVKSKGTHPNETMRLLLERGSCRDFLDKEVSEEILDMILQVGTHAPTAGNLQPYSIIKLKDPTVTKKLGEMCHQSFIGEAPVNLLFCIDWRRIRRWAELELAPFSASSSFRHFWVSFQDVIITAQNICTAADAMGLGSVYIGTILEYFRELREMFQLPKQVFPVILLCLGYPSKQVRPRKKLGTEVVVHEEVYRDLSDEDLIEAYTEKYTGRDTRRVEITEKRLETIAKVCTDVHGGVFAERCLNRIRENGYITTVQRYFGLHYRANRMPKGNLDYLEIMEEFGFHWFKEFQPPI